MLCIFVCYSGVFYVKHVCYSGVFYVKHVRYSGVFYVKHVCYSGVFYVKHFASTDSVDRNVVISSVVKCPELICMFQRS